MIDSRLIDDLATIAADIDAVARVYLFGSRVKGTNRPDSDLDIAVEMMEDEPGWMLAAFMEDVMADGRWHAIEKRYELRLSFVPFEKGTLDAVNKAVREHGRLIFDRLADED